MSTTATALVALLVDTSGSMNFPQSGRQRIDIAADVTRLTLQKVPHARVVLFNSFAGELPNLGPAVQSLKLPPAAGSTAVHLALEFVGAMTPRPEKICLISDGEPDDAAAALAAARALAPIEIDAFHIGFDNDHVAVGFLRELSQAGGLPGVSGARSLDDPAALADEITLLLGGPAR
jgi:hypothetical protein